MDNIDKTMKFDYEEIPKDNVETVCKRGYNAVNQIVGIIFTS